MTLPIYRLRRLLATIAILLTLAVAGMYFYARSKAMDAVKTIPGKIGIDIKQTAQGFQFSKSDGKRTLFTVQASNVKEFKLNGNAELHNVSIILYGRDSSRYDQIYGDDFAYNQKTGDVTAKGEVQIDLVANPSGLEGPDQTTPKDSKNPVHLKTRDLVFNRESGNAWTDAEVEFRTPQASGSAVGVKYAGKTNTLTLASQIRIELNGRERAVLEAKRGSITNDPRQIVLEAPQLTRSSGTMKADQATLYLGQENHVERVSASGDVTTDMRMQRPGNGDGNSEIHGRADQAEFLLPDGEEHLQSATLSGNVHFEEMGAQNVVGSAGRVVFDFVGDNQLQKVHAIEGAHLSQKVVKGSGPADKNSNPQDFDLTAPIIDFTVAYGHMLEQAVTSGAARITITSVQESSRGPAQSGEQTVVTAGKFLARFNRSNGKSHLASIQGLPDVRITNSVQGQPDRVSTSDAVSASFFPQAGIESITQKGHVAYSDNQPVEKRMQAWADTGRYTPSDRILVLTGSPRITNGSMATTANTIRINRGTGDALAEGDVKSTYSDLKEQPNGALLAASSPIHVTAHNMTARNVPAVATYSGNARLWQGANVIEAPTIQFDRAHRSVMADGTSSDPVHTVLVQTRSQSADHNGSAQQSFNADRSNPIDITAKRLTYVDSDRTVHYEGGVVAKAADFSASSKSADAFLRSRTQAAGVQTGEIQPPASPGQLDHMVAQGDVLIQQPNRQARGETLTYTAADDKFVLTGGPPSIFDAEQRKITAVSLTFFRRDDRVLVEGEGSTPVITTTRVAR